MKVWMKVSLIIISLLTIVYMLIINFMPNSQHFKVRRILPYGIDKVTGQFRNLQNFTSWNVLFGSRDYTYTFYTPYEGAGSQVRFIGTGGNPQQGDLCIRYENPKKKIRYLLQNKLETHPYVIDVHFRAMTPYRTEVQWEITTPPISYLQRYKFFFSKNQFSSDLNQSIKQLLNVLSNKVEQNNYLANIKTDSIIVEEQKPALLIGISASTTNKKENLLSSLLLNHDRLVTYLTKDLKKKEDEYGRPIVLFKSTDLKDKEISYFYGMPINHNQKITDNNFSIKQLPARKTLTIYYKGKYTNRLKAYVELQQKAKKDSIQSGYVEETLLTPLSLDQETTLKISLPILP